MEVKEYLMGISSCHHVGPEDRTQAISFVDKCLQAEPSHWPLGKPFSP